MPYDEDLARRLREVLSAENGIGERRMFGGAAFLVDGNLCVGASHDGGLLVRADPDQADEFLTEPHASPMEMRGRRLKGWIRISEAGARDEAALRRWVERGVMYARTLPAK